MKISQYFELQPYSLLPHKKELYFFKLIKEISKKHKKNSMYYKKFFNHIVKKKNIKKLSDLPYLTTNIFKEMEMIKAISLPESLLRNDQLAPDHNPRSLRQIQVRNKVTHILPHATISPRI